MQELFLGRELRRGARRRGKKVLCNGHSVSLSTGGDFFPSFTPAVSTSTVGPK